MESLTIDRPKSKLCSTVGGGGWSHQGMHWKEEFEDFLNPTNSRDLETWNTFAGGVVSEMVKKKKPGL